MYVSLGLYVSCSMCVLQNSLEVHQNSSKPMIKTEKYKLVQEVMNIMKRLLSVLSCFSP